MYPPCEMAQTTGSIWLATTLYAPQRQRGARWSARSKTKEIKEIKR